MDKTSATIEQLTAAIEIAGIALQAITEAGERGIPSGVLYAAMMGTFSIETYESMLSLLLRSNAITRDAHHVLRAK